MILRASKSAARQTHKLYLLAILLSLASGGVMMFQNKVPHSGKAPGSARNLDIFAQGEVAAFRSADEVKPLPELSLHDVQGKPHSLREFQGKIILLNLWASWCVPCAREMPQLDILQKKRGGADFTVLTLSLDSDGDQKPKGFFKEKKIRSLVFFHDRQGAAFQTLRKAGLVEGLPTSLLIDRGGRILGVLAGPADWASEDALKLIDGARTEPRQMR